MEQPLPPSRRAFRIAGVYVLVAALWIILTDPLIGRMAGLPELFTKISLLKGLGFVAVTGLLLFWVVLRDQRRLDQAVAATRQNEQLLEQVLEALPVGVWILDAKGRILEGNPEGKRIWGGARHVGIDGYQLFKGWWMASGKPLTARDWGAARAILEGESSFNEQIEIEAFDGEKRLLLHSAVPLRDGAGDVSGAIVVNQDITELKQAEAMLQDVEELLAKLLDNAPALIYVTCADGRIRLVNRAWCELVGMQPEQATGRHAAEIFPAELAAQYLENNRRVLENQKVVTTEEYMDLPGGRRYFLVVKFPVYDPRRDQLAVAGISFDITEQKILEAALRADRKRLSLLASELTLAEERERRKIAVGLHDEIAQPLALAQIRLGQVLAEDDPEICISSVAEVRTLLEETIRKVRTLTFELSPPTLYELGLGAALRSLAETFATEHDLEIFFHADDRPGPLSQDLQVLLFHATRELLFNIVKHARASHASVTLASEPPDLRLCVEDDGIGFDPAEKDGDGFGLFSIRERIRSFGGRLGISPGAKAGTRVTLTVPLDNQARDEE